MNHFNPEKTLSFIDQQIAEIEADSRYQDKPASTFSNTPLALIQVELKAKMRALLDVQSVLVHELAEISANDGELSDDQNTTTLYLVWNHGKSECVGFLDQMDADFASTGDPEFTQFGYSTLADSFREVYEDEADEQDFEIQKVELESPQ